MGNEQVAAVESWLKEGSPAAALVMRQWLVPVEGQEGVIFPPTYATPEGLTKEEWLGYNIDRFQDGTSVCQIDSAGSQANRMEPIFKRTRYAKLVPQILVKAGQKETNLLDAGHRAGDALVRYSDLRDDLEKAFYAWQQQGNALLLAKIAPTSLVFGAWDSRVTNAKLPRILRSVIRAFQVEPLHRSAQYIPPVDYVAEEILDAPEGKQQQDSMSELGLSHAPAAWGHGGVLVRGGIRRDATVNLVSIRALGADPSIPGSDVNLRRYILGLSLVCFTAPQETFLREGCHLVPDTQRPAEWEIVHHDGCRKPFGLAHDEALAFAESAAKAFAVGADRTVAFSPELAKQALGQSKQQRKAERRRSRAKGAGTGGDA